MGASIRVDASGLLKEIQRARTKIADWTPALAEWARAVGADVRREWAEKSYQSMYLIGQDFRRVAHWKGVPPMYRRKDGTLVPPWGGNTTVARHKKNVARGLKGKASLTRGGTVKGRKRPSNKRVKSADIVGQDTGKMMREFTTRYLMAPNKRSVKLYTVVDYAEHQNKLRKFNELGSWDQNVLNVAVERKWRSASAGLR